MDNIAVKQRKGLGFLTLDWGLSLSFEDVEPSGKWKMGEGRGNAQCIERKNEPK